MSHNTLRRAIGRPNDHPILTFLDPNQPTAVTGYNVYRSDDPKLPYGSWPLVAFDVRETAGWPAGADPTGATASHE